eukprot:m51a1_g10724 hypothetical protein (346) ;mRNA; f:249067-259890
MDLVQMEVTRDVHQLWADIFGKVHQMCAEVSAAPAVLQRPQYSGLSVSVSQLPQQAAAAAWAQRSGPGTLGAPRFETTPEPGIPGAYLESISAMPAYERWSHEELKWEDVQASRGQQQQPQQPQPQYPSAFARVAPAPVFGQRLSQSYVPPAFSLQSAAPAPVFGAQAQASPAAAALGGPFAPQSRPAPVFGSAGPFASQQQQYYAQQQQQQQQQSSALAALLRAPNAPQRSACATPPPAATGSTAPAQPVIVSRPPALTGRVTRSLSFGQASGPEFSAATSAPQITSPRALAALEGPASPAAGPLLAPEQQAQQQPFGDVPTFPQSDPSSLRTPTPNRSAPVSL